MANNINNATDTANALTDAVMRKASAIAGMADEAPLNTCDLVRYVDGLLPWRNNLTVDLDTAGMRVVFATLMDSAGMRQAMAKKQFLNDDYRTAQQYAYDVRSLAMAYKADADGSTDSRTWLIGLVGAVLDRAAAATR